MNFDLEAAKRGEPIEYQEAYGWVELPFIGVWDAQHVVCKAPWNDKPEIVPVSKLRMAKKREVMRYRVSLMRENHYGNPYTITADSDGDAKFNENEEDFIKWITDWQEYDIGSNDE